MGSLKCPLCCRAEFPNRRALQQHLLDVLDLLKCPTCAKGFTSILGLVQHLSLSSCNVEVGVNFDEHFVTYVDCSFMKIDKQENRTISQPAKPERAEPVKQIHVSQVVASCAGSTNEIIVPDSDIHTAEDMGVVIECDSEALQGDIICINLDQGIVVDGTKLVVDSNKLLQKTSTVEDTAPSQTSTETDSAKKIAVPNKRKGLQTSKPILMEDIEITDENISYIYQCEVCLQKYISKSEFDLHECGDIKCETCGTVRKTKQALKLHQKLHEREELERKMNEPSTETITCSECGETIGNNMIEVHMKSHKSGLKIFNCKLCSNTYLSMSKLNEHLKSHGNTCAYKCEICKKEFKTFGYLKAHMETHNSVKKYKCSYCDKCYHRKWDKIKHEYIHTGEKPIQCHICGKKFRVHYCLKLHLRTHTNERPYECKICHKRFKSQAVYSHHIKLHGEAKPYKCPHCPKIFKTLVAMIGHKNRHEKPYSCDVCNRRFASKYDVKIHMPIHINQENKDLFKCIICDAVYARNHALIEHLKEHKNCKDKDLNIIETMAKAGRVFSVKECSVDEFTLDDVFVGQEEEVIGDSL